MTYKTRTEYVFDGIKEQILSGKIKGKERLRQELLAAEFEVSRIPIREALLQLEAQGLVKFEPHKGAVVTELSLDEINELYQLRSILEPHVLQQSIPNMQADDLSQADLILTKLERALDWKQDIEHWSELNYKFHSCLYAPSGLTHALDLISTLNVRSDRYIRLQLLYTDDIALAQHEHRQLLELCQNKKIEEATQLLVKHINASGQAITKFLDHSNSSKS